MEISPNTSRADVPRPTITTTVDNRIRSVIKRIRSSTDRISPVSYRLY
jgi:hypothetical protein